MKDILFKLILIVIVGVLMFIGILYATSPEVWYAGNHDSHCEKLQHKQTCHCYERLIKEE